MGNLCNSDFTTYSKRWNFLSITKKNRQFLAYKESDKTKKLQPILRSSYEFKRGYDTQGTKRYKVCYLVNCYFCP